MSQTPEELAETLLREAENALAEENKRLGTANALRLIDCHTHLVPPHYPREFIEAAVKSSPHVAEIINVAECVEECEELLQLSAMYPSLKPCFGIHPVKVAQVVKESSADVQPSSIALNLCQQLERLLIEHRDKIVGLGECGLDFTPAIASDDRVKSTQKLVFEQHIRWSREFDLPLNIHSRSAGKPAIDLLQSCNATKVLLHAFDGRPAFAVKAASCGWKLSVPASAVRSDSFRKWVAEVPLDALCLETDSPALYPVKGPGLRNEPKFVLLSCVEVAKIKGKSIHEVAMMATEAATKLFFNGR